MWKKLFNIIKKIVIAVFIIYGYNLIAAPLEILVPLNIVTIACVAILGTPALFSFIVIQLLVF